MPDERTDPEKRADKSEIRMDHFEQKAAADKFVTEQQALTLAGHIDELVDGVKQLAKGVAGLHYAEHRRNKLLLVASFLVFGFGVVFLLNFARSFDNQATIKSQNSQIQAQASSTSSILKVVLAVTGCTEDDTPEHCSGQFRLAQRQEGKRRILAVECVVRGILNGESQSTIEQKCLPKEPQIP